jgi:hypothetical protein
MEGQAITMANGYPDAATIGLTIVDTTGFALTTAGGNRIFTKTSPAGTPIANCLATYAPAAAANTAPVVTTTVTQC